MTSRVAVSSRISSPRIAASRCSTRCRCACSAPCTRSCSAVALPDSPRSIPRRAATSRRRAPSARSAKYATRTATELRDAAATLRVQTNEVQRSAVLVPGFLRVAARTGLPLRIREIGSSAGLEPASSTAIATSWVRTASVTRRRRSCSRELGGPAARSRGDRCASRAGAVATSRRSTCATPCTRCGSNRSCGPSSSSDSRDCARRSRWRCASRPRSTPSPPVPG